jgi:hypothetical protein
MYDEGTFLATKSSLVYQLIHGQRMDGLSRQCSFPAAVPHATIIECLAVHIQVGLYLAGRLLSLRPMTCTSLISLKHVGSSLPTVNCMVQPLGKPPVLHSSCSLYYRRTSYRSFTGAVLHSAERDLPCFKEPRANLRSRQCFLSSRRTKDIRLSLTDKPRCCF